MSSASRASFVHRHGAGGRSDPEGADRAIAVEPLAALDIAIQIAEGLAAAHAMGVLHLDIKSANIVLGADGHVKILDFGLARLVGGDEPPPLETLTLSTETMIGTVSGTLPYMAPEQLRSGALDQRTDQFAFGVVCYELLSGSAAVSRRHRLRDGERDSEHDPIALSSIATGAPPEFARLVHRMFEKNPDRRFASTRDVLAALKDVRQQLASGELRSGLAGDTGRVPSSSATLRTDARRVPSIAVLAFENLAADAEHDYFAEGLSEDLTSALAHIPGFKVASRTSAFFFKGKRQDIREIAAALGVETVLEGSVRKSGNRIRVTSQLINATDGYHIWSETYDRQVEDVFTIQDEVSRTIAETLEVKLLGSPQQPLAPRHTKNIEAYNLYCRVAITGTAATKGACRRPCGSSSRPGRRTPLLRFRTRGSPMRWPCSASITICRLMRRSRRPRSRPKRRCDRRHAYRGARLAGVLKTFFDWDWEGADREFAAALKLEPNYATTHWWFASSLLVRGRAVESDHELQLAFKAEPWSAIISGGAAFHYYFRRDYEQGLAQARRSLELNPAFGPSFAFQGWCRCSWAGSMRPWSCGDGRRADEQLSLVRAMLGVTYARSGRDVEARHILLELIEQSRSMWISPYHWRCCARHSARSTTPSNGWSGLARDTTRGCRSFRSIPAPIRCGTIRT